MTHERRLIAATGEWTGGVFEASQASTALGRNYISPEVLKAVSAVPRHEFVPGQRHQPGRQLLGRFQPLMREVVARAEKHHAPLAFVDAELERRRGYGR
jgi:hypothetical protein